MPHLCAVSAKNTPGKPRNSGFCLTRMGHMVAWNKPKRKAKKPRTIPFNKRISYKLDEAVIAAEEGKTSGVIRKKHLEWLIFGGKV